MPKISRFEKAKVEITKFFNNEPNRIYSYKEIALILFQNKETWGLPKSLSIDRFLEQAYKHTNLKENSIKFPYRSYSRYIWGNISKYEFYISLVQNSYFTHQTALFLHQLIDTEPKIIYLNFEQSEKFHLKKSVLEQEKIDMAFQRPQRMTNNIATFREDKVFLLNGQNTNKTGISKIKTEFGLLDVTNLERTLIDIVVRTDYAGGIYEVLKIYKRAKNILSVPVIVETLKRLNFIYPYHQAIGFMLQNIGITDPTILNTFKDMGLKYNFYLSRQMHTQKFSEEWNLFYPADLLKPID